MREYTYFRTEDIFIGSNDYKYSISKDTLNQLVNGIEFPYLMQFRRLDCRS